jgi:hypothetical protein
MAKKSGIGRLPLRKRGWRLEDGEWRMDAGNGAFANLHPLFTIPASGAGAGRFLAENRPNATAKNVQHLPSMV